jgi:molybdopterin synthase sulfur carrier subunit
MWRAFRAGSYYFAGCKDSGMAQIHFTSWLRAVVPDAPLTTGGATVGEALDALLAERPHVRSYVLDEQGRLRKHVCIFADGARLPREAALAHPIGPQSQLHVMQALSGG